MTSRRILAGAALLCALTVPAQAQKTKAQLNTEIGTSFPDNAAITPQNLRNVSSDIVNSIMPTAPVVSGNLACFNGTTGLLQDCGNVITGPLTINSPTGTINKGLAITQTAPSSGAPVGPILFNTIDVTNPGISASGTGVWDAFGIKNLLYANRFTMSVTGASAGAGNSALGAIVNVSAPSDGFGSASGVTVTGTSPNGHYMWGGINYAVGFSGSASGALIGTEAEVGLGTDGSTSYRIGVSANSQGPVKGSTFDAAFSANVIGNVIPDSVGTSTPWEHLMALTGTLYGSGLLPISTTGDFFYSDVAGTVAHFANLPNVTVTGNILSFPNLTIAGNGAASFGGVGLPDAGNVLSSCASCGSVLLSASVNGVSGAEGVTVKDTSTNNIGFFGTLESSNTTVRFGQTASNWVEMIATGSATNGLLIGTVTSDPVIIGTNNTPRITVSAAGAVSIPGTINGVTIDNTGWTPYTPTITSAGGTPTTVAGSGRYKVIGKTLFLEVVANLTTVGTATGAIRATVPGGITPATTLFVGSSLETSTGALMGTALMNGVCSPSFISILSSTTTYWVNGNSVAAGVAFEIQ
jgi:hypothetical protein